MREAVDRLHFMDSMRATLMVLGVVLHSAEVFNPRQSWVIFSDKPEPLMGYLVEFISTFRMPAFFVVSGYFCFLLMQKYKVKKFLSVRLVRIIVPLVVTALTLNVLQSLFLDKVGLRPPLKEYITNASYMGHLWFLINLVYYFLLASLLAIVLSPVMKYLIRLVSDFFDKVPMAVVLVILPLVSVAMTVVLVKLKLMYFNFYGIYANYIVMLYLPFFFFGVLLGIDKEHLRKFSTINPIYSVVLVVVSALMYRMFDPDTGGDMTQVGMIYFGKLTEWAAISICFFLFYKFLNQQSMFMRLISDSSYTIYLFHHLFVIMLAVYLIKVEVSAIPALLIMIVVVTAITLLIHTMIISKSKILSFLYNGK